MTEVGLAVVLFASTNLDDIFVLLVFLADPKFRVREVACGQYLGIAALVAISLVLSVVSLVMSPAYIRWLGLVPILIGLKKLFDLWRNHDEPDTTTTRPGLNQIFTVAAITIANGGDNIG